MDKNYNINYIIRKKNYYMQLKSWEIKLSHEHKFTELILYLRIYFHLKKRNDNNLFLN